MRQFLISEELLNKLISYLSTKSYAEVASIFEGIKQLKQVNLIEEKKDAQVQAAQPESTTT